MKVLTGRKKMEHISSNLAAAAARLKDRIEKTNIGDDALSIHLIPDELDGMRKKIEGLIAQLDRLELKKRLRS